MEKSHQEDNPNEEPTIIEIPDNFNNIICDFTNDLTITFPEYSYLWEKWTSSDISYEEVKELFEYVLKVYPERFFDILYQNDEIFKSDNETNTLFLPNVEFKMLFNCKDLTDTTKNAIWKYLQIILFSITNSIKNKNIFGNTSTLFDGIDEGDLHNKLQETMSSIGSFFENLQGNLDMNNKETTDNTEHDETYVHVNADDESANDESARNPMDNFEKMFENMPGMDSFKKTFDFKNMSQNIPNPEELHEHLKGLFDGKIGTIAKEMAEEITNDLTGILGEDYSDVKTTQDVFKKLIKNPKKMIDLVKTIGGKLEKKMKSGDLNQEEIMKEATDIFGKMKGMGGENSDFNDIIKNLAKQMGGLGKNAKMNTGAMNTMIKKHTYMEKMKMKLEKKKEMVAMIKSQQQQQQQEQYSYNPSNINYNVVEKGTNNCVFSIQNEKQEKSYIIPDKSVDELMNDLQLTNDTPVISKKSKKSKKGKK
jgi:hypothetical protein